MDRDAEGIELATGIRLHEVGCAMYSVFTRQFGNLSMRRLPKLPCTNWSEPNGFIEIRPCFWTSCRCAPIFKQ